MRAPVISDHHFDQWRAVDCHECDMASGATDNSQEIHGNANEKAAGSS
jgi:hypothetical protein